jgi:NADP-dependent 3-hydroxy acid dehydrogenase YdfG
MNPNDIAPTIAAITFFVSMVLIFRGAIGKAIARRIEGKGAPDPALAERIEELEHRLADMEQDRLRVAELEERLDFAERLLAKAPERIEGRNP